MRCNTVDDRLMPLSRTGNDSSVMPERLSVALNSRLTSLRDEYRSELESLTNQRESLKREIGELQQAKELFSDETNTLNDRNTDLATQAAEGARKLESLKAEIAAATKSLADLRTQQQQASTQALQQSVKEKALPPPSAAAGRAASTSPALNASTGSTSTGYASTPMNQSTSSASQRHALPSAPSAQGSSEDHAVPATFIAHKVDPVASQATVRKFKYVFPAPEQCIVLTVVGQTDGEARKAWKDRSMPRFRNIRCSREQRDRKNCQLDSTTSCLPASFDLCDASIAETRCGV